MIRVLLDTNVVLDVLLKREPFVQEGIALWRANEEGQFEGYVSAITPINVFYIARKIKGLDIAHEIIVELLATFQVLTLDAIILQAALDLPLKDFEDAAQIASANANQLDGIVTRDAKDYKDATIPIYSPAEFLSKLTTQ